MACVALISLMRTLELEFLEPHPRVVLRKTKEIKSLLEKLAVVQSLLEQSEEKLGVSQAAMAAKVRDIAFKAEEDIESQVIEIVCAEKKSNLLARLLYDMFQCVAEMVCAREKTSPYARLYDIFQSVAAEIEEVVECIKKTNAQLELDTPLTTVRENISLAAGSPRRHTLEADEDIMVGRAKELTQIREMLLQKRSSSSSQERQVMSIVGMGGIGKTTLARSIYNDPSIQNHFDLLGWTTVSNDHRLRKVLCDLCRSVMQMPEDEILMASEADLTKRLRQRLMGHRYLIVVDDIWGAKAWDDVQRCFPDDFNGSRILLTTRLKEVADYTGSSGKYVFNLPFLNSDESWKLFYEKVWSEEKSWLPLELEEVGKRIVRKCNGLPLALVVVAGLLSKTNKSLEKWGNIESRINLQVTSDFHEQCSNILTFSYNNLPYPLKACFLYFGVFPEDSEILIKDLIRLWIAEGFIKVDYSSQANLEEVVAKDHLQDLIDRNLVLIGKQSWGGNMKTCRVHDLLYDLCLRETKNHKLVSTIQSDGSSSANAAGRWLRVQFSNRFFIQASLYSNQAFNKSRTISSFSSHHPRAFFYDDGFLNNNTFKMLRVLDLRSIAFNYAPQFDITDLILLRYLGLDSIQFMKVMEHHSNLQTLIVNRGRSYTRDHAASEWLLGIWKSQKLRHVKFPHPFPEEEDLVQEHLLTVCWLPDFQCTSEFFLRTPNVKRLGIRCGFNDSWRLQQCIGVMWWRNLHYLTNLQKLTVEYFSYTCCLSSYNTSYLPSIYAFPHTIKSIKLVGTILPWRAITIISMLPNLEKLKISQANSMGEEWETSEGGFLSLKILFISGTILKHWYTRGDHFPVLERLFLDFCLFLKEIPTGFTDILTLQFIEFNKCHSSLVESARKIQVEQEDMYGKDDLVVLDYNTWQQ